MTPAYLLAHVTATRVGLGESPIHAIGVFILADIPAGARDLFAPPRPSVLVPEADVGKLPPQASRLFDTNRLGEPGMYHLPQHGFRVVDVVTDLHHSDTPNVRQLDGGDDFEMTSDVTPGKELTTDSDTMETK